MAKDLRVLIVEDSESALLYIRELKHNGFESGLDVPFILISSAIGEDLAVEAIKLGVNNDIMKANLHEYNLLWMHLFNNTSDGIFIAKDKWEIPFEINARLIQYKAHQAFWCVAHDISC